MRKRTGGISGTLLFEGNIFFQNLKMVRALRVIPVRQQRPSNIIRRQVKRQILRVKSGLWDLGSVCAMGNRLWRERGPDGPRYLTFSISRAEALLFYITFYPL